jgi:ribosome-associated protein
MSETSEDRWLIVSDDLKIPHAEFAFTFSRSSGPGGQNVNKVSSKAQLRWPVVSSPSLSDDVRTRLVQLAKRRITSDGDLLVSSQRYRDRGRNVSDCLEKLRALLAEASVPPTRRKKTKTPPAARRRRLEDKRRQSQKKQLRRSPPE